MFDFFKKKKDDDKVNDKKIRIVAPVKGEVVSITEVNDPTFAEKMLGEGVAIKPAEGKVCSPVDGTISMVFDTKHAVSISSDKGTEVLIHFGLDTVKLNGEGFEAHVKAGDAVKVGDPLLTVDLEVIKGAGLDTITPVVICNTDEYASVEGVVTGDVEIGAELVVITPNS